jgi:hypothetical protein
MRSSLTRTAVLFLAESALGNRQYFLNKPHSIGGKKDDIP